MDETLRNTGIVLGGLVGLAIGTAVRATLPTEYTAGGTPKPKTPLPIALGFLGGVVAAEFLLPKSYW